MNYNDYNGLGETGYEGKDIKPPEEEFFHSLYISGQSRKNHKGIVEQVGLLQIRGVDYNKTEVNMIITHSKTVLVKNKSIPGKDDVTECFSYQSEKPWKGTCGKECGANSAIRAADPYCNTCKSNIIIAGILCDNNGKPQNQDGKAIFIFLRGKGVKYGAISDYMTSLYRLDLDPIFTPATEESKRFEKSIVNHKRFVTKINVGNQETRYGIKPIFNLERGKEVPKENIQRILQIAKDSLERFNEKFDWSKTMNKAKKLSSDSYQGENREDIPEFDAFSNLESPKNTSTSTAPIMEQEAFNLEDIQF